MSAPYVARSRVPRPRQRTRGVSPFRWLPILMAAVVLIMTSGSDLQAQNTLEVFFAEVDGRVEEGSGPVTIAVSISKPTDRALSIPITVTPDTAESGDYTVAGLVDGKLTFVVGDRERTFTITPHEDDDSDDETIQLAFGTPLPPGVTVGYRPTMEMRIKDLTALPPASQRLAPILSAVAGDGEVTLSWEDPGAVGGDDYQYRQKTGDGAFGGWNYIGSNMLSHRVTALTNGTAYTFVVRRVNGLGEAVSNEAKATPVHIAQHRTAEQFSQILEAMLAVIARSMGESAQTAIEGRFERHRQWCRLGPSGGAAATPQSGSDHSVRSLDQGESERIGGEAGGGRREEGPVVQSVWGAAKTRPVTGSGWNSERWETGTPGSWLRNVSLDGLAGIIGYGQSDSGVSTGSGMGTSGRGLLVGSGRRAGSGQNRLWGLQTRDSSLRPGSAQFSGLRNQELNFSGTSYEMPLGGRKKETSWLPALWGQGDLQYFDGNLTRIGMNYRGGSRRRSCGAGPLCQRTCAGRAVVHAQLGGYGLYRRWDRWGVGESHEHGSSLSVLAAARSGEPVGHGRLRTRASGGERAGESALLQG